MKMRTGLSFNAMLLWGIVWCLMLYLPFIEMRVEEIEQAALKYNVQQLPASSPAPEPPKPKLDPGKCFHMPRSNCPPGPVKCTPIGDVSVFCCDVDDFHFKEGLTTFMTQNTTNLHVLNPNLEELDVSLSVFRRLTSMALTDGNIGKIVGQFPKYSSIACLNISNNNLTSAKLQPSKQRPFAYLFNLTTLDASANNLTEFPLSLVQSNRNISVDFSGNNYLPCKHFQKAMESNNSSLVKFENYNKTFCALDLQFNWFKDVQIVQLEHLKVQNELNDRCREIRPIGINCTCVHERLQLLGNAVTNVVAVDCSQRRLTTMPTNLPNNTVKLNVSYNNITSLSEVDGPSYSQLRQLIADYNDIVDIVDLEGTKFIDNFIFFSISHNKLKTIQPHVFSNKFDNLIGYDYITLSIGGNLIHCDCTTEKVLKPWLLENSRAIPDYRGLECAGAWPRRAVVDVLECVAARDWSAYIYGVIALEALVLAALVSKVSYDYWVFKSAGYLPWPANKLPRLPCDWLCE